MAKKIKSDFPINTLSANRWSPRAFTDKAIEKEKLQSIMEAARWSASAFNAQPWRFLIGYKGDENYQKIFNSLIEFNQLWAAKAPVLILNCYEINLHIMDSLIKPRNTILDKLLRIILWKQLIKVYIFIK